MVSSTQTLISPYGYLMNHTHTHSHPLTSRTVATLQLLVPNVLHGSLEFTCVLIRLEEMIGCSQHRSKEDPDAFESTHARLHAQTHMDVCTHKALADSNALGRAPSHCVKKHTSAEFGLCHKWFSRGHTTSHPSFLSVQIYSPPKLLNYICVFNIPACYIHANDISWEYFC